MTTDETSSSTARSRAARRRRGGALVALVVGPIIGAALILQATSAAFTATTSNSGNSWTAGTVAISDSQSGTALFNESALQPGPAVSKCIKVTYTGSLAANVRLYAGTNTGTLGQYLDLDINEGTGNAADCSDFVAGTTLYDNTASKTMATFISTKTNFGNGVSTWAPTGASQSKTYRIRYTVQDTNSAQNLSQTLAFTWEARNQ